MEPNDHLHLEKREAKRACFVLHLFAYGHSMTFYDLFVHVERGSCCLENVSVLLLRRCPKQIAGLDLQCLPGSIISFSLLYYSPANIFVTFDIGQGSCDCV